MNAEYRARFGKLSTTNVSDALDALGLKGSTYGISPTWEGCKKIIGEAVTVKLVSAGLTKSPNHLGVHAIEAAKEGDIILVDNSGRLDVSCWGGILANGAKAKGVFGVVIDGACRDVDDYVEADFSVYARGPIVATARGRVMEEATNIMVQFGGVQVRPKDIVMADRSGVVVVPQEKAEEVLQRAEVLFQKEEDMIKEIRNGASMLEVDTKYNYEKMLK
ncbi:RraA family protein [Priestia megaterium]|uniref:RraA family protein n=1 Tax=Priestia megaterium TaxID=1404 RepID=UPI000BFB9C7F|nr:RraA family protein [Priestia megaterium]PGQ87629.1 dimethylmenaquinone methyltransferase [Priestia megaterium]